MSAKFVVPVVTTEQRQKTKPVKGQVMYDKTLNCMVHGDGDTAGGVVEIKIQKVNALPAEPDPYALYVVV